VLGRAATIFPCTLYGLWRYWHCQWHLGIGSCVDCRVNGCRLQHAFSFVIAICAACSVSISVLFLTLYSEYLNVKLIILACGKTD
jgi:hypothetical protein